VDERQGREFFPIRL